MDTICAPLAADSFLLLLKRFIMSLSDDSQIDIFEASDSTCRYLDDFLILAILTLKKWLLKCIILNGN